VNSLPLVSIIIPVHNGRGHLGKTLDALLASDFVEYEIVVVDDGSSDESAELARARGAKVIRLAAQLGPAAARNCGASHASGDILLFVDADVVVRPHTLAHVAAVFREYSDVAAVFGSYDDTPFAQNFISQHKNLLHHFVHQQSSPEAATFWAGCGAIRRRAFEATGGFDERKYPRPSIEDIELGHRLRRKGFRIILDKELQVKHLKHWTFFSLLTTDILSRALPWSRLVLEEKVMINDLNLRTRDRLSAALTCTALASLVLSFFFPAAIAGIPLALMVVFLLNLPFYRFLTERRGYWFALRSFAMSVLYYLYSSSVFTLCYCMYLTRSVFGQTARGERHPQ
jgi:glycosyltransferase involved in cell wall biosynthesis